MKRISIIVGALLALLINIPSQKPVPTDVVGIDVKPIPTVKKIEQTKHKAVAKKKAHVKPKVTSQKPAQRVISSGWHYDCRPQRNAVKQAVYSLGLGKDWQYIDYIFNRESCHDPGRLNSIGCKGLGQACGHASFTCGPNDITCQVKWFNNYAMGKGGWYRSYQIWLSKHWW